MDVIFYFAVSLLITTIFCYVIFLTKNSFQREDIGKTMVALQTVGTNEQKEQEKEVITYQSKINDFTNLLENHEFSSNVFAFMQGQTMSNVWFKQFSLDGKNSGVQLSGEADDLAAFSRQVATFEKNEYVKSVGTLSSALGGSSKIGFNISLILDQKIFSYLSSADLLAQTNDTAAPSIPTDLVTTIISSSKIDLSWTASIDSVGVTGYDIYRGGVKVGTSVTNLYSDSGLSASTTYSYTVDAYDAAGNISAQSTATSAVTSPPASAQQPPQNPENPGNPQTLSSQKLITSFHFLLDPEVVGSIDDANHIITLNVPYGANVKNLISSIVVSPGATVVPASGVSQDFVSPVVYNVIAEDGSTQSYQVRVIIGEPPVVEKKSNIGFIVLIIAGVIVALAVVAAVFLFLWRRNKQNK